MTFQEYLKSSVAAELPDAFLESLESEIDCNFEDEMSDVSIRMINRARARVYLFLATVPNVSEGGVSILYNAQDKKMFLDLARKYANLAGETGLIPGVAYGYKGQNI